MSARLFGILVLVVLAVAARVADAEMRLDVNEELRRAEEQRQAEELRRSKLRIQVDPVKDLEDTRAPRHIPDARYRVAVFSFEDPDNTGLGNTFASLLGREILLRSNVGSIGVLRYEGSLAPSAAQPLSYFDKVEKLVETQDVALAVWGMVRRNESQVLIDTYVQLPPRVVEESFRWSFQLPEAMGSHSLGAHLRPARMLVQSHRMSLEEARGVASTVKALDVLRGAPDDAAPVVATLPVGAVYWVTGTRGDWIEISTGSDRGWARVAGLCTGTCAPLIDSARFSADLLQFMQSRRIPEPAPTLGPDAHAAQAQLAALESLSALRLGRVPGSVLRLPAKWLDPAAAPPGGAAFANIRALDDVASSLQAMLPASSEPAELRFDRARIEPSRVQEIAFTLAGSSLKDPRNTDVLRNLSVLFRYAGETRRADLAGELADKAGAGR